jgi:ornithine decarboxylase
MQLAAAPPRGAGAAADGTVAAIFDWARDQSLATPVHLLCQRSLSAAVSHVRAHLDARISYAAKANTHPRVLAVLRDLVDEFNVTNLAHLWELVAAGVEPARIAYVNPVTTLRTARAVLDAGVTRFVVDDDRGLDLILALDADVRLTVRLRPSRDGHAGESLVRFGTTGEAVQALATRAAGAGARVEALSFFVGTDSADPDRTTPYRRALDELAAVHRGLAAGGIVVPVLNIGGGFPGSRRRFHRDHPDFFERIGDHLATAIPGSVEVVCEPGRYLSEPAMAMLGRVVADRRMDGRRLTYLDASSYAGLFETSFIDPGGADLSVVVDRTGPRTPTQLLGPIMDSYDVIKRDVLLPPLAEGDLILFPNTGAYSWGYAASCEGVRQPDVRSLPPELDDLMTSVWFD